MAEAVKQLDAETEGEETADRALILEYLSYSLFLVSTILEMGLLSSDQLIIKPQFVIIAY